MRTEKKMLFFVSVHFIRFKNVIKIFIPIFGHQLWTVLKDKTFSVDIFFLTKRYCSNSFVLSFVLAQSNQPSLQQFAIWAFFRCFFYLYLHLFMKENSSKMIEFHKYLLYRMAICVVIFLMHWVNLNQSESGHFYALVMKSWIKIKMKINCCVMSRPDILYRIFFSGCVFICYAILSIRLSKFNYAYNLL